LQTGRKEGELSDVRGTVFQQRTVTLPFMETEVQLLCPQKPSTILSSEPYESGSYLHIQFNIILLFMCISVILFIPLCVVCQLICMHVYPHACCVSRYIPYKPFPVAA